MMTPRNSYRPRVPIPTGPRADISNARAKTTSQHSAAFQTTVSSLVQPSQQPKSSKTAKKRAPPSHKDVAKLLQPSQSSTPPPPELSAFKAPRSLRNQKHQWVQLHPRLLPRSRYFPRRYQDRTHRCARSSQATPPSSTRCFQDSVR